MASTIYRLTSLAVILTLAATERAYYEDWVYFDNTCLQLFGGKGIWDQHFEQGVTNWTASRVTCQGKGVKTWVFDVGHYERWHYYRKDRTCLKIFGKENPEERLTWAKARESCQAKGGDLVVLKDRTKQFKMYKSLIEGTERAVWIGVVKKNRDHVYRYVNGKKLGSYRPWRSTSNPNHSLKRCVGTVLDWSNLSCNLKLPYMCSVHAHGHHSR